MYLGVTHESSSIKDRSYFAFDKSQRKDLINWLKSRNRIDAICMVSTCNRMEIYFESSETTPLEVRDLLLSYVGNLHGIKPVRSLFQHFDHTIETVNHLVHVAQGLRSAVVGDKQIINQVKESYHEALRSKNQGSLLERSFQVVFRSHKRIFKETSYHQGSTSTAYSSLKLIESYFSPDKHSKLRILLIGAGEIAQDILKYLPKFDFRDICISNRTSGKSRALAEKHSISFYDWRNVECNKLEDFDVVISAVSNRKNLIKSAGNKAKRRLWIDLAMPSNISKAIADQQNKIYNIDEIASLVCETNELQLKAIPGVEKIIKDELEIYIEWLKKAKLRAFLKTHKHNLKKVFLESVARNTDHDLSTQELEYYAETLANKLVRKSVKALNI